MTTEIIIHLAAASIRAAVLHRKILPRHPAHNTILVGVSKIPGRSPYSISIGTGTLAFDLLI